MLTITKASCPDQLPSSLSAQVSSYSLDRPVILFVRVVLKKARAWPICTPAASADSVSRRRVIAAAAAAAAGQLFTLVSDLRAEQAWHGSEASPWLGVSSPPPPLLPLPWGAKRAGSRRAKTAGARRDVAPSHGPGGEPDGDARGDAHRDAGAGHRRWWRELVRGEPQRERDGAAGGAGLRVRAGRRRLLAHPARRELLQPGHRPRPRVLRLQQLLPEEPRADQLRLRRHRRPHHRQPKYIDVSVSSNEQRWFGPEHVDSADANVRISARWVRELSTGRVRQLPSAVREHVAAGLRRQHQRRREGTARPQDDDGRLVCSDDVPPDCSTVTEGERLNLSARARCNDSSKPPRRTFSCRLGSGAQGRLGAETDVRRCKRDCSSAATTGGCEEQHGDQ